MNPTHKKILRSLSLELRHILEGDYDEQGRLQPGDLERRLNEIGIWRERAAKPLAELPHLAAEDKAARRVIDAYLAYRAEAGLSRAEAVAEFVRESAYTWANRLLALRCMEARAVIDEVILQKDIYGGRSMVHNRLARRDPAACAGEDDGLFSVLLAEFAARAGELPALFDPDVPAIALRPSVPALKRCLALLSGRESAGSQPPADDAVFAAPDALGWAYQYWNAEEKDRVFEKVRTQRGKKIEGADIIPATQLYTEPYMVKFLVQNSLGATWLGLHPESTLAEGWDYYVKDADRTPGQGAGEPGSSLRSGAGVKSASEITFLDPAAGSGHFLLEAFDLFYQMYEEEAQSPISNLQSPTTPAQICASILNHNLFGIDIDERAVQIAAAALWMRAKETAWDLDPAALTSFHDHLVATNIRLPQGKNHLAAFLRQHPEDRELRPALETVFEGLQNAHELGSLLQLEEPVEKELRYLQSKAEARAAKPAQLDMFAEHAAPKQGALPLGVESYEAWKGRTLARLLTHFEAEAEAADLSQAFFGQTAGQGLRLFDLLARRYDVVAANPPWMGSKNMGARLATYLAKYFSPGKRDVYAAFILRSLDLSQPHGYVAMITQHTWLFLSSYSALRTECKKGLDQGLLHKSSIECIAHLGRYAFSELGNAVIQPVMFILRNKKLHEGHKIFAVKLNSPRLSSEQSKILRQNVKRPSDEFVSLIRQRSFLKIPDAPVVYWAISEFLEILQLEDRLSDLADVKSGIVTGNNERHLRFYWEASQKSEYQPYAKGGGYSRWAGFDLLTINWGRSEPHIAEIKVGRTKNPSFFGKQGWTYALISQGSLSVRYMSSNSKYDNISLVVFPKNNQYFFRIGALLMTRPVSYLLRCMSPNLSFNAYYVRLLPLPHRRIPSLFEQTGMVATKLKQQVVGTDLVEALFYDPYREKRGSLQFKVVGLQNYNDSISANLHTVEGLNESIANNFYGLSDFAIQQMHQETGIPAGWHPLLPGYDALPPLPDGLPGLPAELAESLHTHPRLKPTPAELAALKANLHTFYQAGPGAKAEDLDLDLPDDDDDEDDVSGAHIPIPTETFLEELSVKLQLHPISVYWLLQEGREKEGWRCLPEEQRLAEDRFTVLVLRLLGHRWPKQLDAGEPVPEWADADGIIPLTGGGEEPTLLDRVRERLNEGLEARDLGLEKKLASSPQPLTPGAAPSPQSLAPNFERQFEEIAGESLEKWLGGSFFKRHVSQFKKRPIAWQLVPPSLRGRGGRGVRATPAFSCLLYYHKLDGDLLPKLRSQYVGPLKTRCETELRTLERLAEPTADQSARKLQLEGWLAELAAFDETLRGVEVGGFAPPGKKAAAQLRQFAVDEAALSLKGRWLARLAEIIRAGQLPRWQAQATALDLSPDFAGWLATALDRLDLACSEVGPPPPAAAQLPAQPTAADLAPLLTANSAEMVQQALAIICRRWLAQVEEQVLAPIDRQIDHVLNTSVNPLTAKATAQQLKLDRRAARDKAEQVQATIMATTGFNLSDLTRWLAAQPLYDAVSSLDGRRPPPASVADFIAQESAYAPDINDGVRVNIAPLQAAGLLASNVLSKKDMPKAIANRAEWRADERRWVREGKLPRPGWWGDE